jgi:hypothetical protein
MKVDDKTVMYIIEEISGLNDKIVKAESEYNENKYKYKHTLLELKYSDEYSKYKTIKEKEERAILELSDMKMVLVELETEVQRLKYEKEVLLYQLKYLYNSSEDMPIYSINLE